MPNLVQGLEYTIPSEKEIRTDEEFLEILKELRREYEKLISNGFKFLTTKNRRIGNLKHFLEIATSSNVTPEVNPAKVIIRGSGYLEGVLVRNGNISYDLSEVGEIAKYWDQERESRCNNCAYERCSTFGESMDVTDVGCDKGRDVEKQKHPCPDFISKYSEEGSTKGLSKLIKEASGSVES